MKAKKTEECWEEEKDHRNQEGTNSLRMNGHPCHHDVISKMVVCHGGRVGKKQEFYTIRD